MKPYEMEPTWLLFPGSAITFPAVYQPSTDFGGGSRFSISADASAFRAADDSYPRMLVDYFANDKLRINVRSRSRPEVGCNSPREVPKLVEALQYLDARNVSRDRIFALCPLVSVGVVPYAYTKPSDPPGTTSGYLLLLQGVCLCLPTEEVLCSSTLK